MAQKKPPVLQRKTKQEPNKKALIWIGSILGGIVLLMTILLILNQ